MDHFLRLLLLNGLDPARPAAVYKRTQQKHGKVKPLKSAEPGSFLSMRTALEGRAIGTIVSTIRRHGLGEDASERAGRLSARESAPHPKSRNQVRSFRMEWALGAEVVWPVRKGPGFGDSAVGKGYWCFSVFLGGGGAKGRRTIYMNTCLSAPLLALLVAGPVFASPQIDDAQALLREGELLGNGARVVRFTDFAMSEQGDWIALAITDQGSFETDGVLIQNGAIILEEGGMLPSGETIGQVFGVDLSPDGAVAWTHRIDPGILGSSEALFVDGVERLRSGSAISGSGIPANSVLKGLRNIRFDAPLVIVEAEISVNSQALQTAILLVDLSQPGTPTLQVLAREGATFPGMPGPVLFFLDLFDVVGDGTFVLPVAFDLGSGASSRAVLTDQGWFAVDGAPVPGTNATWSHGFGLNVACAPGSIYLISSQVETPAGDLDGIVLSSNGILAREGTPFAPLPGETTGIFDGGAVGLSTDGIASFAVQLAFDGVLVSGGEAVLREATSTISGTPVGNSVISGPIPRIAVGSGGRELLFVSTDPSTAQVLALLELEVGVTASGCTGVPNSTGAVGVTRGFGTGIASANDLVIESTDLPPQQFALLAASRTPGFAPGAGGSVGNLCLGGAIGRFNGSIAQADAAGFLCTPVNLTAIPQGSGTAAVRPGETWYFQRWHRDVVGGAATSNLTTSLRITFR